MKNSAQEAWEELERKIDAVKEDIKDITIASLALTLGVLLVCVAL